MDRAIKEKVGSSFDRYAFQYDRYARIQSVFVKSVEVAVQHFTLPNLRERKRIVDLGCGTGELMSLLCRSIPEAELIGVDLSPRMLRQVRQRECNSVALISADLEATYLRDASIDLIVSSSALQWASLELACREMARIVKSDGFLVLMHIVEGSLERWRDLWGMESEQLHPYGALPDRLIRSGFEIDLVEQSSHCDPMTSFEQCMQSVRGIGAGVSLGRPQASGSKARFDHARTMVEREIQMSGVYHMHYRTELVVAKKVYS